MRHDDDAERLRKALSQIPVTPDPAGAFAALDKTVQPGLWEVWQGLVARVADESPEELQEWPPDRIAATSWLNTLVHDVHARVRQEVGGDAEKPELPPGTEECMQELHGAAEGMLSALVLPALEHLQLVLEAAAAGEDIGCPACALESRFTDVLRSVMGALQQYHTPGPEGEADTP
ncbi:MAG: hypothetical protein PVH68_11380 [Armatimonadota bacterium]|jgi:hypothetical protein